MPNNQNLAVRILITARDQTKAVISGIGKAFESLDNTITRVGLALATYFSISRLSGLFSSATSSSADFEAQLSRVQAVTNATAEDMRALRDAADQAGRDTSFSAGQAAEALEVLGRSGKTASESIDLLPAVLATAKVEGVGLADAATIITTQLDIFGKSAAQGAEVADILATGSARANTNMQELGFGLKEAGGLARAANQSLEETTAQLLALAQNGLRGAQAGTSLRNILGQLSDPASKARTALRALGIDTGNLNDVIDGLNRSGPRAEKAIRAFGIEAGPGLRALLNVGVQGITEHQQALEKSEGAVQSLAQVIGDNLNGRWQSFLSVLDAVGRKLTTPLLDPLKRTLDDVIQRLRTILEGDTLNKFATQLADAFERGRESVSRFLDRFNFEEAIGKLTGFVSSTVGNLDGLIAKFSAVGAGLSALKESFTLSVNATGVVLSKFAELGTRAIQTMLELLNKIGIVSDETIARGNQQIAFLQKLTGDYVNATITDYNDLQDALNDFGNSLTGVSEKHRELADAAEESGDRQAEALSAPTESIEQLTVALESAKQRLEDAKLSSQDLGPALQGVVAAEQALAKAAAEASKAQSDQSAATESTVSATSKIVTVFDDVTGKIRGYTDGLKGIITSYRDVTASTLSVEDAFERLGVKSSAELKRVADEAKRAFDRIRTDGDSTTSDVARAFEVYAERAKESGDPLLVAQIEILEKVYGTRDALGEMGDVGEDANTRIADSADDASDAVGDIGDAADGSADQIASGTRAVSALAKETERLTLATIQYLGSSATAFGEQGIKNYNELLDDLRAALDRAKSAAESLDKFDPASAQDAKKLEQLIAQYERFIIALKQSDSTLNSLRDDRVRDLESAIEDAKQKLEDFNNEAKSSSFSGSDVAQNNTRSTTPTVPAQSTISIDSGAIGRAIAAELRTLLQQPATVGGTIGSIAIIVARQEIPEDIDPRTSSGARNVARLLQPELDEIERRTR